MRYSGLLNAAKVVRTTGQAVGILLLFIRQAKTLLRNSI